MLEQEEEQKLAEFVLRQYPLFGSAEAGQHLMKGVRLLDDLRYEVAQLELLASQPVRQAAGELVIAHEKEVARIMVAKSGRNDPQARSAFRNKIRKLHEALVESTRTDLGLGSSSHHR